MEIDIIQVSAERGMHCVGQSRHLGHATPRCKKRLGDLTVFLTDKRAEKLRKVKYITVSCPSQTEDGVADLNQQLSDLLDEWTNS